MSRGFRFVFVVLAVLIVASIPFIQPVTAKESGQAELIQAFDAQKLSVNQRVCKILSANNAKSQRDRGIRALALTFGGEKKLKEVLRKLLDEYIDRLAQKIGKDKAEKIKKLLEKNLLERLPNASDEDVDPFVKLLATLAAIITILTWPITGTIWAIVVGVAVFYVNLLGCLIFGCDPITLIYALIILPIVFAVLGFIFAPLLSYLLVVCLLQPDLCR